MKEQAGCSPQGEPRWSSAPKGAQGSLAWPNDKRAPLHHTFGVACEETCPAEFIMGPAGPPKKPKQEAKGGKDKGKGKSSRLPGCAAQTPDGSPVCYRFNTPGEKCKQKKCKFRHCCGICFSEKHAMFQCAASKRQPPDTAGEGGTNWKVYRILYLFSGRRRVNSVASYAKKLAKRYHFQVEVIELDSRHCRHADFSKPAVQEKWLRMIREGGIDALLCTPPCSTFSRAPWANDQGPYPVSQGISVEPTKEPSKSRPSRLHLLGHGGCKSMAPHARAQLLQAGKMAVMEQPEDLGKPKRPRTQGTARPQCGSSRSTWTAAEAWRCPVSRFGPTRLWVW